MVHHRIPLACSLLLLFCKISAQQGINYPPNKNSFWYFLSPTAFAPPPGKAIFQNGMLAASQYQKTAPKGNTYTIGLIPTLLLGENEMPVWVSAHRRIPIGRSIKNPSTVANMGGFFLSIPGNKGERSTRDFSLFYLNFTFGNPDNNISIGGAFLPTGLASNSHAEALALHGMVRLGPRSCLLTENYVIHDRGNWVPISMSGWRGWRKQSALDIGFMLSKIPSDYSSSNQARWLALPWLAFHKTLRYDIFSKD